MRKPIMELPVFDIPANRETIKLLSEKQEQVISGVKWIVRGYEYLFEDSIALYTFKLEFNGFLEPSKSIEPIEQLKPIGDYNLPEINYNDPIHMKILDIMMQFEKHLSSYCVEFDIDPKDLLVDFSVANRLNDFIHSNDLYIRIKVKPK